MRSSFTVREYADADADAVLALINADRLVGQPECTKDMLAEALAGRSAVDSGWWAELSRPVVEVLIDHGGQVAGVVSYATRPRDGAGLLLWLHSYEKSTVVRLLIDHALSRLERCPLVEAFAFATALGLGLEALPVRKRPATRTALRESAFADADLWRMMHRSLPALGLPQAGAVRERQLDDRNARQVELVEGDIVLGTATVGDPVAGIGVLWWIEIAPTARGRGLGMALLGSCLGILDGLGAGEVILYVDDDEPGGDRDRAAANRLYEAAGFVEVDRLHSFELRRSSGQPRNLGPRGGGTS